MSASDVRAAAAALLVGALLIGLALGAQLPPWEGFDETVHYSYVQQIAETGTWPRFGDPASAEVEASLDVIPSVPSLGARWSYRDFFAASPAIIEAGRAAIHAERDAARPWRPGRSPNWQAQHPPLYYILLAPAYALSKSWSLIDQLLLLRGLSYVIAWAGLCVATFAAFRQCEDAGLAGVALCLALPLWPQLFPTWFPEMARLGNDSLVTLIAACAWVSLQRLADSDGGAVRHAILGFVFGLGLLTKVTFLPFAVVCGGWLAFRIWQARRDAPTCRRRIAGLAAFGVTIVAVAGWWYAGKYFETGNLFGVNELVMLGRSGGLLKGLQEHAGPLMFVHGVLSAVASFLWAGTWSFVRPPAVTYLPLCLTLVLLAIGFRWSAKAGRVTDTHWISLAMLVAMCMALLHHLAVLMAAHGFSSVPGWYLHSFAPVFATLVGQGLAGVTERRGLRPVLWTLVLYPCLFLPAAMTLQGVHYAGCGVRTFKIVGLDLQAIAPCAGEVTATLDRLSLISFPRLALGLFAAGWILTLLGAVAALCRLSAPVGHAAPVAGR